ncbi:related to 2-polyprenyl-6-methoxyphenol hydroxylase and related FAD-dependent oxidoreductases [Phialocephala subalpina]|uniref:Related to 2-polyprenyl-6-methoxyphenol hydroxylase and related FAD-dependent oxidoreductases n=1 Tax=Phialocephala subalpina TaxID=576137 RepID=A0A1L7WV29_9HELO|nr:related to 2-polyprenyl-6-methoxyphenol hydroxylase and related FAD-dependent oxidoreductases [Phialocephala subalpina]
MTITSPVIILGAGISGLALGQGLLKASIPFHIYERDSSLNVRAQGYRVRINDSGIDSLKQLIKPELYARLEDSMAITTTEGAAPPVMLDTITGQPAKLNYTGPRPPAGPQPLNADRSVLRMVLTKGLEDNITFSKEFSFYTTTSSGIIIHFTDGTSVTGSLLVGADGTKSKVRSRLLPDHKNIDTEGRWFFGKTTITPSLLSNLHPTVASQMTLVQDRTNSIPKSLLLEPVRFKDNQYRSDLPADYIYWVVGSRKDALDMSDAELLSLTHEDAANQVLALTSAWDPRIRELFKHQDIPQTSFLKIDSAKPDLPVWETDERVTLIGDAVHAMSPAAGVGAVTALRSAEALFRAITAGVGENRVSKGSLRAYEDEMRGFAGKAIGHAFFGGKMLFGMRSFEELIARENEGK